MPAIRPSPPARPSWRKAVGLPVLVLAMVLAPLAAGAKGLGVRVVDGQGAALAQAAVWAIPIDSGQSPTINGSRVEVAQKGRQFRPRVTVISTGSEIVFPNHDRIRHHVYSFSQAKLFELKLYGGTEPEPVRFDRPGTIVIGCNIHDQMVAFVRVVDSEHHGLSDDDGRVTLDLPPGRYRLLAWHPDVDLEHPTELPLVDATSAGDEQRIVLVSPSIR